MWSAFISEDDLPSLGYAALDEEHGRIVQLMNELWESVLGRKPLAEQRFLLHELEVYLRINCRSEEQLMEHDAYPHTHVHEEAHRSLYRRLHDLERILILQRLEPALQEIRDVRQSLLRHMSEEDMRVARWHRIHNISSDSPD
jgi:hemerythrin-like metal-binding protein